MQAKLALKLGDETGITSYWYIPAYTTGSALGFLIAGANSDLFGRRLFLLYGEVMASIGMLITATAKGPEQFTAGLAIAGWGGGFCQMYVRNPTFNVYIAFCLMCSQGNVFHSRVDAQSLSPYR
jgi:MFS family permease